MFAQNELGGSTYSNNYTVATNYLELPVPSDVTYNPGKRTVTFKALDANYCVRVEVQNAKENSWSVYADCATPKSSSIKINDDRVVDDVRVSMCLLKRKEVCGEPLKGKIGMHVARLLRYTANPLQILKINTFPAKKIVYCKYHLQ